jgi:hypothetical protein
MDSTPLVSIGMPVYNEELHLEDALRSLLSQSFKDFELIISDNASTDRTGEICLTYAAKDPRVRYSRMKTNVGSIANFNHLVQLANAPYFFFASGHHMASQRPDGIAGGDPERKGNADCTAPAGWHFPQAKMALNPAQSKGRVASRHQVARWLR